MAISAFERVTNDRTLAATVAVHAAATMAMVGLIWTVQVVHYPLFESVGAEAYPNYQSRHIDRIGAVLVVPWGLEGLSIVALLVLARERTMRVLAVAGAALMGLILLVTMIWAAPVHGELLDGFAQVDGSHQARIEGKRLKIECGALGGLRFIQINVSAIGAHANAIG